MAEEKKEEQPAAPEKEKGAAPKTAKKKSGKIGFFILMIVFGAAVPVIYPTLFLLVGMIPTLVALLTDSDRNKSSFMAIGPLNAAGLIPFVIELWKKGQTLGNALDILGQSTTWLVMFGAAGLGQLIVFAVPHAVASMSQARAETRIAVLKQNLEKLKATWGPEVATTKPLEKVARGE